MATKILRTSALRDAALFLLVAAAAIGLAIGCADDLATCGFIR
jgi:hypothetical protein